MAGHHRQLLSDLAWACTAGGWKECHKRGRFAEKVTGEETTRKELLEIRAIRAKGQDGSSLVPQRSVVPGRGHRQTGTSEDGLQRRVGYRCPSLAMAVHL